MLRNIKIVKLFENEMLRNFQRSVRCVSGIVSSELSASTSRPDVAPHPGKGEVKPKPSYFHANSEFPLVSKTIGQLFQEAVERNENFEAFVDWSKGIRKDYGQLLEDVDRTAAGLLALGLKRGDRIALWGPNSYEWVVTYLAAARAGLCTATLNPVLQANEVRYCLNKIGVKALICAEKYKIHDYYKLSKEIAPGIELGGKNSTVPTLKNLILFTDLHLPGAFRFQDLILLGSNEDMKSIQDLQLDIQVDEPCNIQFTSGTTGQPKAATLTHHGVVNNSFFLRQRYGMHENLRSALVIPLFHCSANVGTLLGSFHYCGSIIIPGQGFDALQAVKCMSEERCNTITAVPTMYVDILNVPDLKSYNLCLDYVAVGAAICPEEVMRDIKAKLNPKYVISAYGMTECSPVTFSTRPGDAEELIVSTVGTPYDHVEAKIVDGKGRTVPIGTSGELWVRGYMNMLKYWGDEEKTKETITEDRWLKTGDVFVMDENGYGRVVGRIKDMINRGGENVYPREIEELLHTHPKILEAQVIGVPDPRLGEDVCCWIRLHDGKTMTAEDVHSFCKKELSYYKIPRYIHFTDTYPKTESGKVQKFKLVAESIKIFNLNVSEDTNRITMQIQQ